MEKNVLAVIGTRTEALHLAPVIAAARPHRVNVSSVLLRGARFAERVDDVFELYGLKPDFEISDVAAPAPLNGWKHGQLNELAELLSMERPRAVLVHGEGPAAFATVLMSSLQRVPVGLVGCDPRGGDARDDELGGAQGVFMLKAARWVFARDASERNRLCVQGCDMDRVHVAEGLGVDALARTLCEPTSGTMEEALVPLIGECAARHVRVGGHLLVTLDKPVPSPESLKALCGALAKVCASGNARHVIVLCRDSAFLKCYMASLELDPRLFTILSDAPIGLEAFLLARCRYLVAGSARLIAEARCLGKPVVALGDCGAAVGVWRGAWCMGSARLQTFLFEAFLASVRSADFNVTPVDGRASERIAKVMARDLGEDERSIPTWERLPVGAAAPALRPAQHVSAAHPVWSAQTFA